MANLHAKHEHEPGRGHIPPEHPRKSMPLWPFLLLALLLIPLAISFWPRGGTQQTAYYDPAAKPNLVIHHEGHDWVPVPGTQNRVSFPTDQMRVVGQDKGYNLYANVAQGAEGGGGGPVSPGQTPPKALDRIYLQTGPNSYVPMIWQEHLKH